MTLKGTPFLYYGEYEGKESDDENLLIFRRFLNSEIYEILINYSTEKKIVKGKDTYQILFGEKGEFQNGIINGGAVIILKVIE
ncbi:MAG: hypothetical protein PF518_05475 [Spirochaetaceae bacterium]|nr:hypothetical protein [Spirochaetaceae bacterium]